MSDFNEWVTGAIDSLKADVAKLAGERDELRDELEAVRPQYEDHVRTLNGALRDLEAERDTLAQVLANMAECAHDANATEPMCACPCHAPGGAEAERDRLRAVVRKLFVAAGLALEENGEWLSYASEEYASRHNLTSDEMATCRAALDGSEATDG